MARFFIDRPIFAWVIAILIMMAGAIAITTLPVAQYPAIAPPNIGISAVYPGASAKTVEDAVTQVIEQKMNGIDHLPVHERQQRLVRHGLGRRSPSTPGPIRTSPRCRCRTSCSWPCRSCPEEVQQPGRAGAKAVNNFLIVVGFVSRDGSMTRSDLSDYAATSVVDPISRVTGVGDVQLFGAQYAMRIWLDPQKLTSFGLDPGRRLGRGPGPERAGLGRPAGRHAGRGGPADQRHHHRPDPPADGAASSSRSCCARRPAAPRCA